MRYNLIGTNGHRDFWQIGDEVYARPHGPVIARDTEGRPMDLRWECSRAHFDLYIDTFQILTSEEEG